ncbi:MAG: signal peptidase II [Brevirhabdus sp.]
MRLLTLTAFVAFVLDQASKYVVVFWLGLYDRLVIEVLPPFLVFRMGWNTGINFGFLGDASHLTRWALIVLAVGLSVLLVRWARHGFSRPVEFLAAGLIIGGAIGNALDRLLHGAVADFLNMSCCGIQNPYTFNVADIFIFAGAAMLIFLPSGHKTP